MKQHMASQRCDGSCKGATQNVADNLVDTVDVRGGTASSFSGFSCQRQPPSRGVGARVLEEAQSSASTTPCEDKRLRHHSLQPH